MGAKQLAFFEDIDEKEVRKVITRELKQYKALKVAMENKVEQEQEGTTILFPALINREKEKNLKVKQIDRALQHALDDVERQIIEQKYLSNNRVKDINIYLDLGLAKDQYYSHKRQAILLIATALGII
ncbi:ArpU family phage packaging/lysis transcriptional regulator [Peribacillus sp. B-H-3]|uniref:ArpU family phage packaging/lysis transcriptional regulator n=1 Tax=Peribacillus sp. B-H-3 TaxID=3400420 RepID=UPI003B025A13